MLIFSLIILMIVADKHKIEKLGRPSLTWPAFYSSRDWLLKDESARELLNKMLAASRRHSSAVLYVPASRYKG
jgi:hypothetical protein